MVTRILICDDHPMFRGGLAAALGDEPDFEICGQVGSLAEVRVAVVDSRPDLVLLDVDLPDGRGTDAVAEVAASTSVVMISAHDDPAIVRRAMQDGALGYIRKDAEPLDLLRLVRKAAEGKTALSGEMALRVADSLRRQPDEISFEKSLESLSPRQREVVALIAEGKTNREVAHALCISEGTVKNYVTKILEVVGVSDRTKLAILLVRQQMAR
ncbi:MAG: response regulator transcription factor [Actinobacteria bacterium]|nr:response regulator transcription factor [Actinomycetota bacterium]